MDKSGRIEIYSLSHPITNEVRYIGKAVNSNRRLKSHLLDSKRRITPLYNWINELKKHNLTPIIKVIKITDEANWAKDEIDFIKTYRAVGFNLLNVAKGGNEPFCSKEQRAANGKANAKNIHSSPKRKRIWQLKQQLACNLRWLRNNGREEKANQIQLKLNRA